MKNHRPKKKVNATNKSCYFQDQSVYLSYTTRLRGGKIRSLTEIKNNMEKYRDGFITDSRYIRKKNFLKNVDIRLIISKCVPKFELATEIHKINSETKMNIFNRSVENYYDLLNISFDKSYLTLIKISERCKRNNVLANGLHKAFSNTFSKRKNRIERKMRRLQRKRKILDY